MTSSVKGPRGPGGITPPSLEAPEKANASSSFRDALGEARAETAKVAPGDPIARALLDGTLDPKGAVDALVERALAGGMAQGLTPDGVEALRAHLMSALEQDPALAALVSDLENAKG
jgi:hypothetical protein